MSTTERGSARFIVSVSIAVLVKFLYNRVIISSGRTILLTGRYKTTLILTIQAREQTCRFYVSLVAKDEFPDQ